MAKRSGAEAPKYRGVVDMAVDWAGGKEDVAKACDMTVKGVEKWIDLDAAGQRPLRFAKYWRVIKLAELSEIAPWRLTGVEMPEQFRPKPS